VQEYARQKNACLLGTFSAYQREFKGEMNAVNKGAQQLSCV
jgi:hypothetical protein